MPEAQPVLVLHGVGNRGHEAAFTAQVARLNARVGSHLDLIPVYWGDLAANPDHIAAALPDVRDTEPVRSQGETTEAGFEFALSLFGFGEPVRTDPDERIAIVADSAVGGTTVRDEGDAEEVRAAIAEAWPDLDWLPRTENRAILDAAGILVRDALDDPAFAEAAGGEAPPGPAVRDEEQTDLRGPISRLKTVVRTVLKAVDGAVGAVMGEVGGRLNHVLREQFGPNFVGFFGDIIAYLSLRDRIHAKVRDIANTRADGWGADASRPIGAIGHSLGGVILFDLAVSEHPLYLNTLVTFGSQAPFFHAIAQRGSLPAFDGTNTVKLPNTIGDWINLWEPLDLLAFIAARVFMLDNLKAPKDREVGHDVSSGLWTHSVYWQRDELVHAVTDAFGTAPSA